MDDLKQDFLNNPFRRLNSAWCELMRAAEKFKKAEFQDDADDILKFFNGNTDDFWGDSYSKGKRGFLGKDSKVAPPDFQMKYCKAADATQVINSRLYSSNPQIAVRPRRYTEVAPQALGIDPRSLQPPQPGPNGEPGMPSMELMQWEARQAQRQNAEAVKESIGACFRDVLNYEQIELDKQSHMRRIIDEALLCGMGVGWTEVIEFDGSDRKLVGTFYEPVKNLLLDPDANCWEELQWVARKRCMPYWEAEELFGYKPGALKEYCRIESQAQQAMAKTSKKSQGTARTSGKTADTIEFWEIYSRMGIGDRLKGVPEELYESEAWSDAFPQYCKLCVCEHTSFPLNLHPSFADLPKEELAAKVSWPIPFYLDNQWPCVPVVFHPVPNQLWPMSHFKPALGEMQFIMWCFSFLANKVRTSCGTTLVCPKEAQKELEELFAEPGDNKILWAKGAWDSNGKRLIDYIQAPEFHGDIWNMLQAMLAEVDKRLGMLDPVTGDSSGPKDRSATESDHKFKSASGRINDMGTAVEAGLRRMCVNEAIANWALLSGADLADVLGPDGMQVWDMLIKPMPAEKIVREYFFEIIAGSTRKRDKQAQAELMNTAMQVLGPALQNFSSMGMFDPWNALVVDWAKANDIDNPERYLVQPPPPQPDPKLEMEQQKLAGEMQKLEAQGQQSAEKHQLDIQRVLLEMQRDKERHTAELVKMQATLVMERERHQQDILFERQKFAAEMQRDRERGQQEMAIETAKASQEMQLAEAEGSQQLEIEERRAESELELEKEKASTEQKIASQKSASEIQMNREKGKADVAIARDLAKAKKQSVQPKKKDAK